MSTAFKTYKNNLAIDKYKQIVLEMLKLSFPYANNVELECAVDDAISNTAKDTPVSINNNYKNQDINSTIFELTNYIISREPIVTSYGVLFSKHGVQPNPIYRLVDNFIRARGALKDEMFKYPKGSEEYEKYNLLQLLAKIDVNGYYGASGMYTCIYYNLYCAATVTRQGKSCNSAAALFFESFLNNNVPFSSMNELVEFIYNVRHETRTFRDDEILDKNISMSECFYKLMSSTGFGWIPSETEMTIIWDMLSAVPQIDINRLFYKNNLFCLIDNRAVNDALMYMLQTLTTPYVNPNTVPDEIADGLHIFYNMLYEFVYYDKQIIDRIDKMSSLIRSVSVLQDTDSAIVSLDGWYRKVSAKTAGIYMPIKDLQIDLTKSDGDITVTEESMTVFNDYDFINDSVIDREIPLVNPSKISAEDGLRYSIINIISYCVTNLANDFMAKYAINSHSDSNGECMLVLKNEFLIKRLLATDGKKHYAGKMELQEGHTIQNDMEHALDVKGIECFKKSTVSDAVKARLNEVLYNDILDTPIIDQLRVLKSIAIIEHDIYQSIRNGEKKFFKPLKVKSISAYEDPMRIQGIKASHAYNALHEPGTEALDMSIRNSIDIVKVDMNVKNIDMIKDSHPYVYDKAMELFNMKEYAAGIDAIAIPLNESVPDWILRFVRYNEIINNNVAGFPLESIGLYRGDSNNNSTNLIAFG